MLSADFKESAHSPESLLSCDYSAFKCIRGGVFVYVPISQPDVQIGIADCRYEFVCGSRALRDSHTQIHTYIKQRLQIGTKGDRPITLAIHSAIVHDAVNSKMPLIQTA